MKIQTLLTLPTMVSAVALTGCATQNNSTNELEKQTASKSRRPNVIFLLADDMGWGDTGYNGNKIQLTPSLDSMAKAGIRFDRFYAACPVCGPTRASLMTGQNGSRLGMSHWGSSHLCGDDILISNLLKDKGYTTGHFGKWHLGLVDKEGKNDFVAGPRTAAKDFAPPWLHGFDTCFSTENVAPTWDPMKLPKGKWGIKKRYETGLWGNNYWTGTGKMVAHDDNLSGDDSRVIMDRVIPFVKKEIAAKRPFFAYVCFHTPHTPTISGGKYLEMYKNYKGRHHYGAITAMDEQIGRLRNTLRELGQEKNTLIWVCSDNGAQRNNGENGPDGGFNGYGSNLPFKGWKCSMNEGGIRVPSILLYPAMFKKNKVVDMPCVTSDVLPTLMTILGDSQVKRSQPQDGMDIYPALCGDMTKREKPIGFAYARRAAWMTQRYKLIVGIGGGAKNVKPELFDILADPYEKNNLANEESARVAKMNDLIINWIKSCNTSCGDRYKPVPLPQER